MALLKIVTFPNPVLLRKAEPLTDFGPKEQKLFDDMVETMYVEDGVGLSAPQIGISKKILVASSSTKRGQEHIMVNPQIREMSGRESGWEGCLSFPDVSIQIARAKKIQIRYQDRHGNPCELTAHDFFARVLQHEVDHLEGVLFIDRASFEKRQEVLAQYQTV